MSSSPCILTSAVLLRRRCCDQIFMPLFPKVPGQVLLYTQASPPKGFPFFGMAPSALLSLSQADLQLSKAGSLSEAARSSLLLSAQMSATNPSDVQLQPAGISSVCRLEAAHDSIGNNQHLLAAQSAETTVFMLFAWPQLAPCRENVRCKHTT